MVQSSLQLGGTVMSQSCRASSERTFRLLTEFSIFFKELRVAAPALAAGALLLIAIPGHAQVSSRAANPAQIKETCDGKLPAQKSHLLATTGADDQQAGADAAGDHLKLSTKATPPDSAEPQGQFCSREHADPSGRRPLTTTPAPEQSSQPVQPTAPSPIAAITGSGLTIRANGQDFVSVIEAIRSVTGITVDMPPGGPSEPVFMNLGPVSTKDALLALLEGTKYNYMIVSSERDSQLVKRVILSPQSSAPAAPLIASAREAPEAPQPELYGGQGVQADAEAQNTEPVAPAPPPPILPASVPSSVPTGINIQQLAAQSNKTPGQILDQLQKQQLQVLDDQVAAQQQAPQ